MEAIDFTDALRTGIEEIDSQHEVLIDIHNELVEAMQKNHGNRVMNEILARLFQYSKEHFQDEEALLEAHHYPELQKHRQRHLDLVKSIRRYIFRHTRSGERITHEMVDFIGKWITDHIMVEDMAYVDCVSGRIPADEATHPGSEELVPS